MINLAGRSGNCRYTPRHRQEILDSRVRSTRVVGQAVAGTASPPGVWLQQVLKSVADKRKSQSV